MLAADIPGRKFKYPAIVKPRFGRGSVNVFTVQSEDYLRLFSNYVPDALIQDFVEGTEFTVVQCSIVVCHLWKENSFSPSQNDK